MIDPMAVATLGMLTSPATLPSTTGDMSGATMQHDFDFIRGTTFRFDGVARKKNGNIIPLTGATLAWRLGATDLKSTNITLTESDGITATNPTAGKYEIHLAPSKTLSLEPGLYKHQFEVTESGGDILAVLTGRLDIIRDLPT